MINSGVADARLNLSENKWFQNNKCIESKRFDGIVL